jgi:hypothetical protein
MAPEDHRRTGENRQPRQAPLSARHADDEKGQAGGEPCHQLRAGRGEEGERLRRKDAVRRGADESEAERANQADGKEEEDDVTACPPRPRRQQDRRPPGHVAARGGSRAYFRNPFSVR